MKYIALFMCSFLASVMTAQNLPLAVSDVAPLETHSSPILQELLSQEIAKNPKWKSMVKANKMSIGIVDMSNVDRIEYAGLNDEFMMYAASLPKIAILLAAMDAIENGELKDSKEVRKDMHLMISKSNNAASTRMIDRVGYEKIEQVLRSDQLKLYDEEVGGGLWVGKRYAAGGRRHPEPMKGLSHAATARQVCSFYYQLAMGNLINPARSLEMLKIMKDPALHHKFVNTLDKIAPKADIYRKSGSWKNWHSDSVLVWGPERKYILVALIDDSQGEQIVRDLVIPLEKAMKKSRALAFN
ncbi:serine hydrolase [uncultured Dokdonia sp.]|jgi:beta-lactamase class A|uniref:serine hydrolase n=1 Tax=unclassified Dokdonia TaxID=2615033 RepID=UPI0026115F87|nr:serine hydrolase [uncultured Dokdonia sp.]|tara:strand:- start:334938 stop:335834 length:897 start_codon:yes stop_codon:yes gene_type:complete